MFVMTFSNRRGYGGFVCSNAGTSSNDCKGTSSNGWKGTVRCTFVVRSSAPLMIVVSSWVSSPPLPALTQNPITEGTVLLDSRSFCYRFGARNFGLWRLKDLIIHLFIASFILSYRSLSFTCQHSTYHCHTIVLRQGHVSFQRHFL